MTDSNGPIPEDVRALVEQVFADYGFDSALLMGAICGAIVVERDRAILSAKREQREAGIEIAASALEAWATSGLSETTNGCLTAAANDLRSNAALLCKLYIEPEDRIRNQETGQ